MIHNVLFLWICRFVSVDCQSEDLYNLTAVSKKKREATSLTSLLFHLRNLFMTIYCLPPNQIK